MTKLTLSHRDEPSLLVRPQPFRTEGPSGYLFRLAESNWMPMDALPSQGVFYDYEILLLQQLLPAESLDPGLHRHVQLLTRGLQEMPRAWIRHYCRFCPVCLEEEAHWRTGWELVFHDACPVHGVWLIDQCASCSRPLSWKRPAMLRCQCGSDLRMEKPQACPENVAVLSEILLGKLVKADMAYPSPLQTTNLEQTQRLVRYLGTYMDAEPGRNPLKLQSAQSLLHSWRLSSLSAEILMNWPEGFHNSWERIAQLTPAQGNKTLDSVFGRAYHYLYKALKEAAFNPTRESFEHWLSASWTRGLAKRNKRLPEQLLKNAAWVPSILVRETLGISYQRLQLLIREGALEAETHITKSGRKHIMVRRDQIESLRDELDGYVDMKKAGALLGFGKKRMRQLLRMLFPHARRSGMSPTAPWQVQRHEIEHLLALGEELPVMAIPDEGCISLGQILRFWNWPVEEVCNLIEEVRKHRITPAGQLADSAGISRWVFVEQQLRAWRAQRDQGLGTWVTVKQLRKMLNVHHEVAYGLVKDYFANGEAVRLPGKGFQIKRSEVERFRAEFVFGTEVAAVLGVSPRKAKAILAEHHIEPVSGPDIDHIRQLIYRRDAALETVVLQLTNAEESDKLTLS